MPSSSNVFLCPGIGVMTALKLPDPPRETPFRAMVEVREQRVERGLEYIVCARLHALPKALKERTLDPESYRPTGGSGE